MKLFKLSLILAVISLFYVVEVKAQVNPSSTYVSGYTRTDGTYVSGYYKTTPNSTNRDNYTTKPNVNPYTGTAGYIQPDNKPLTSYSTPSTYSTSSSYPTQSSYSTGSSYTTPSSYSAPISTGSRGGQYYINSNGNKTYIKRQ